MKKGAFRFPMIKIEGGGSPDPVIYCPANGYIPDPEIYTPPVVLPESTTQSITFICNASVGNWKCNTYNYKLVKYTAGSYLYELFDNTGTLVDSWTSGVEDIDFDFPTNDRYYTVRISIASPNYITGFYNNDASAPINNNCIEAIICNVPNATKIGCKGNTNLTSILFMPGTSASIYSIVDMFDGCKKMNYFNPDWSAMTNLAEPYRGFKNSFITKVDWSTLDTSNFALADSIFMNAAYLEEVIFPNTFYETRMYFMFDNTPRLKRVTMPITIIPVGTPNNSAVNFFRNSGVEGEIIFPQCEWIAANNSMFLNCQYLEVIRLKGNWSALTISSDMITGCVSLVTLELPRIIGGTTASVNIFSTALTALKYFIAPDDGYVVFPVNSGLISITGECDTTRYATKPSVTLSTNFRTTLSEFQCAKLKVQNLTVGTSLATQFTVLTALELDWANSPWASGTPIRIAANIDATEINRIFTALPALARTIDVRYSSGYATCDKTIATAKGWTVL